MKTIKSIALFFREGSSDKVYNVQIIEDGGKYSTLASWGRRGGNLTHATKAERTTLDGAEREYDKIVKEKRGKGYQVSTTAAPTVSPALAAQATNSKAAASASAPGQAGRQKIADAVAQLLNPVEEDEAERLVKNSAWIAQRKYDGVRILARISDDKVDFANRKGETTGVAPEISESLKDVVGTTILDGEVVATKDGSVYWAFDLLMLCDETAIKTRGYTERYDLLSQIAKGFGPAVKLAPCATTTQEKRDLVKRLKDECAEGVVFKRADAPHSPGRPASGGPQVKLKFTKTADVFLTGWDGKAFQMAVKEKGSTREVGRVYTGSTETERQSLRDALDNGEVPVCEVRYLYATDGDILFQPVYVRRRTDKKPGDCKLEQLVRTNRSTDGDEG